MLDCFRLSHAGTTATDTELPVKQSEAQEIDLADSGDVLARYECLELEVRDVTSNSSATAPMQVGGLKTRLLEILKQSILKGVPDGLKETGQSWRIIGAGMV